ncbi:MAG: hypothetical protein E6R13_08345 [Spirochaetes bacterium]|nr:MAG: hypothetical protein E6R13_08345 [Spirochaetota bacterium]
MKTKNNIQEEAGVALDKAVHGTAAMSVGSGKTRVGLKHMERQLKIAPEATFLVVAPKKSIFRSWIEESEATGLTHLLTRITFTTYLSLLKQSQNYRATYFDEGHSLLPSHDPWLKTYKGIRIGLTGTPPKFLNSSRGKIFSRYIPVVYTYLTDDAVADKILNKYNIIVHRLQLSKAKTIMAGKPPRQWLTSEENSYEYWTNRVNNAVGIKERQIMSILRMKALMDFPTKEKYAKKLMDMMMYKTIIFANTQQQAEKFGVPTYHSKNPDSEENLEEFKKGRIDFLACVLQLNEGINIPDLKCGIIMHSYGNERKASQRINNTCPL